MDINYTSEIGEWLKKLLTNLTYTNSNKKVFKRVLLGYDESKVKSFGTGAIAVTYVRGVNSFSETFGRHNMPENIESVVAFIIKNHSDTRYKLATEIMDLLLNKFRNDKEWFEHTIQLNENEKIKLVRGTFVKTAELTLNADNGNLNTVCVFSLKHHVQRIKGSK